MQINWKKLEFQDISRKVKKGNIERERERETREIREENRHKLDRRCVHSMRLVRYLNNGTVC